MLGIHADLSYNKGAHNAKLGVIYGHTFLREHNQIGLVDPTLNDPTDPGV